MSRKPISKSRRFRLFKRDGFTCQYCGQKPPSVVLEIDHIIPVSKGGGDGEENLITACFDCNRGKSSEILGVVPQSLADRAILAEEKYAQVKAYESLMRKIKRDTDKAINEVCRVYEDAFDGWTLRPTARTSIKKFLESMPPSDLIFAMERAVSKCDKDRAFKYFCGICWNIIRNKGR